MIDTIILERLEHITDRIDEAIFLLREEMIRRDSYDPFLSPFCDILNGINGHIYILHESINTEPLSIPCAS